jgi:hypothetical protein
MSNAITTFLFTVVFLLALTRAAGAQWWPMPEPYCPWCYQERRAPASTKHVHREKPKPKPVERHAQKPKPKPRVISMSVDEERAWIKGRVQSFCGRHPKDIACQPTKEDHDQGHD